MSKPKHFNKTQNCLRCKHVVIKYIGEDREFYCKRFKFNMTMDPIYYVCDKYEIEKG
jgi:hypothetical protein